MHNTTIQALLMNTMRKFLTAVEALTTAKCKEHHGVICLLFFGFRRVPTPIIIFIITNNILVYLLCFGVTWTVWVCAYLSIPSVQSTACTSQLEYGTTYEYLSSQVLPTSSLPLLVPILRAASLFNSEHAQGCRYYNFGTAPSSKP
jgi:hypothetical protein